MAARFLNLPAAVQRALKIAFHNWVLVPAAFNPGNHRALTNTHPWIPIPPANDVLATGGEGIVHVWCQVDPATQLITDRVVVKQVIPGQARYNTTRTWVGNNVGTEPLECRQANLAWALRPQHILSCLGYGDVDNINFRYKLYFEYCDHGNMKTMIQVQKNGRRKPGKKTKPNLKWPEPFLWYLFRSLADACLAMEGVYPAPGGVLTRGMLHGDLHPGNIVFTEPAATATSFGLYPVPKVSDFGSSRKLTNGVQGRAANSGILNDPMFLAFAPPELSTLAGVGWEVTNMRVSKKSNIYQIGLVMAAAIRRMAVVPENNWRNPPAGYNVAPADQLHHDPGPGIGVQQIPAHKMNPGPKKYSNALINLVMTCLSPAPAQRPTAAALLAEIDREGVNNGRYKNTNTLAVGAAIPAAMKEYRIQKTRPRYAVGRRF